jgi:hypothetical protein
LRTICLVVDGTGSVVPTNLSRSALLIIYVYLRCFATDSTGDSTA